MKISDQGFTERLPAQANTTAVENTAASPSARQSNTQPSSDTLQLSNLATQLQQASAGDSTRSARVSAIAAAVKTNSFQIDPARISSGIVSEAIAGAR